MPDYSGEDDDEVFVDVDNTESTVDDFSVSQPSTSRKGQHPPSGQEKPSRALGEEQDEDEGTDTLDYLYFLFKRLYNDRFGWTTFKGVVVFIIAMQYVDELRHISIPLKNYYPFDRR